MYMLRTLGDWEGEADDDAEPEDHRISYAGVPRPMGDTASTASCDGQDGRFSYAKAPPAMDGAFLWGCDEVRIEPLGEHGQGCPCVSRRKWK